MQNTTLYYRKDTSDKVYRVSLEKCGKKYVVNFTYGRRGKTMTTDTKTPYPVSLAHAKFIYDDIVKEKTAKGYTTDEGGGAPVSKPTPIAKKGKVAAAAGREIASRKAKPRAGKAKPAASIPQAPADGWKTVIEERLNKAWPTATAWRFGKSLADAEKIIAGLPRGDVRTRTIQDRATGTRLAVIRQISQAPWSSLLGDIARGDREQFDTFLNSNPTFSSLIPEHENYAVIEGAAAKKKTRK